MTEEIAFENVQVVKIPQYHLEIEMKGTEVINVRDTSEPQQPFTKREKEIYDLVRQKMTNREIAEKLFISRRTVEIHRSHIMAKLGIHDVKNRLLYHIT